MEWETNFEHCSIELWTKYCGLLVSIEDSIDWYEDMRIWWYVYWFISLLIGHIYMIHSSIRGYIHSKRFVQILGQYRGFFKNSIYILPDRKGIWGTHGRGTYKVVPQFVSVQLVNISTISLGLMNGGYIELVIGIISQRSHHWGAPPCINYQPASIMRWDKNVKDMSWWIMPVMPNALVPPGPQQNQQLSQPEPPLNHHVHWFKNLMKTMGNDLKSPWNPTG